MGDDGPFGEIIEGLQRRRLYCGLAVQALRRHTPDAVCVCGPCGVRYDAVAATGARQLATGVGYAVWARWRICGQKEHLQLRAFGIAGGSSGASPFAPYVGRPRRTEAVAAWHSNQQTRARAQERGAFARAGFASHGFVVEKHGLHSGDGLSHAFNVLADRIVDVHRPKKAVAASLDASGSIADGLGLNLSREEAPRETRWLQVRRS